MSILEGYNADTVEKEANTEIALKAFVMLMLGLGTKGIGREKLDASKLNKKRTQSGKSGIPVHEYVRITHLQGKSGELIKHDENHRKSPIIHWRRGHIRQMSIGKGRTGTRACWIEPIMVNFISEKDNVPAPVYVR